MIWQLLAAVLIGVAVCGVTANAVSGGLQLEQLPQTTIAMLAGPPPTESEVAAALWLEPGHMPAELVTAILVGLFALPTWLMSAVIGVALFPLFARPHAGGQTSGTIDRASNHSATAMGTLLVLAALAFGTLEAGSYLADGSVPRATTVGGLLQVLRPEDFNALEVWRTAESGADAIDMVRITLLNHPVWAVLFYVGILFHAGGRIRLRFRRPSSAIDTHNADNTEASRGRSVELAEVARLCSGALISVACFSALVNVLMLTGAIFMMEVYDRVLPSRSVPTLIALCVLAFMLFNAQIILDIIRNRLLVRVGRAFTALIASRAFETSVRLPLIGAGRHEPQEPLREVDTIRTFLSSPGPVVLFDMPWMPLYLVVIYLLHPALGATAAFGAVVLIILALLNEFASRRPTRLATLAARKRFGLTDSTRRNAEAIITMGMLDRLAKRWQETNDSYLSRLDETSDVAGALGSIAKGIRMMLQSAVLAVGAFLVIGDQASAGVIIASAILVNRALAPVDLAISHWKGFIAARQSWRRLEDLLVRVPAEGTFTELPEPRHGVRVERISVLAPDKRRLVVKDVSFALESGQAMGLVGPSGSGKSSLVRMLVGAWRPLRGKVTLDGAALNQRTSADLGRHIGYLPQTVELLPGTIAENIARFSPDATDKAIIAAARAAGVHDMIVSFADGYETDVGDHGEVLSVGQRQRIALARALFGDPFLVVLDEPNSNLDADGDAALLKAIMNVRERGGIVVVVAHRPTALASVDRLLAMKNGQVIAFGDRDDVIAKLRRDDAPDQPQIQVLRRAAQRMAGQTKSKREADDHAAATA